MSLLTENAVLALFFVLGLGYLVGKLRVGPITLGGICGTLIVAMLLGAQTINGKHVTVNSDVKNVAFALFIFSLGYIAGPQFFANMNAKGLRFGILCLVEVVCVMGLAYGIAKSFNLDVGTASGILAGAATESAVVGTAQDAIGKVSHFTPQQITHYQGNVATAYSVCYLFGLITIVLLTSQIIPMLLRINLKDSSHAVWEKMRGASGDNTLGADEQAALPALVGRTYQFTLGQGGTVSQVEAASGGLVTIEGIKRGQKVLSPDAKTELEIGDRVLIVGERSAVMKAGKMIGPEIPGVPGLDSPMATRQLVVTSHEASGKTLGELRKDNWVGSEVFVTDIQRADQHLPATPETELHIGDTLSVVGARKKVDAFITRLGAAVRQDTADYVYIFLGICCGVLLGMISVKAGGANLTLGTGGGCLIAGLIFGWARTKRPTFGAYPPVAASTIKDLGLATFIAVTGLSAGPTAGALLKQYPALLPISGVLMVLIPAGASLVIGRSFLKIEPPILIGAIAGQQCSTPAITAVTNTAQSSIPMLGYTITYTISNFLLPLTGPLLVGLLTS